jgi:hypothetical protein
VLSGGVNRQAFVNEILAQPPDSLLLLAGGLWYEVNGTTLRAAVEARNLDNPSPTYQAVLGDGGTADSAAAEIIDRVNALEPLEQAAPAELARLYWLHQALTPAQQAQIERDEAIVRLMGVL